jgi:hypothetical protein
MEFVEYFSTNFDDRGILFHICRLEDAINQTCNTSLKDVSNNNHKINMEFV